MRGVRRIIHQKRKRSRRRAESAVHSERIRPIRCIRKFPRSAVCPILPRGDKPEDSDATHSVEAGAELAELRTMIPVTARAALHANNTPNTTDSTTTTTPGT